MHQVEVSQGWAHSWAGMLDIVLPGCLLTLVLTGVPGICMDIVLLVDFGVGWCARHLDRHVLLVYFDVGWCARHLDGHTVAG